MSAVLIFSYSIYGYLVLKIIHYPLFFMYVTLIYKYINKTYNQCFDTVRRGIKNEGNDCRRA